MRAHASFFALSILAFALAAPAHAQTRAQPAQGKSLRESAASEFAPRVGKLVRGRCHEAHCDWFSLEAAEFLGASERGWLMKIESRWWRSHHPDGFDKPAPRRGVVNAAGDDRVDHVFCSKTQPTILEAEGERWRAFRLAPAQPPAESQTRVAFYLAACHNAGVETLRDGEALARKLGYKGGDGGFEPQGFALARPQDVLAW
jgi:hypothetical protein